MTVDVDHGIGKCMQAARFGDAAVEVLRCDECRGSDVRPEPIVLNFARENAAGAGLEINQ
jgi:hypothetical protein